jgi:hypothetical protein
MTNGFQPGDRVFIKESVTENGVAPALIGTVLDDLDDVVYVRLDQFVDDVPGVGRITQWTDPNDECQDFVPEFVVPIVGAV